MVLTARKSAYLKNLYYDIRKAGSLRGPKALYKAVKRENKFQISLDEISHWLEGESVYTRWKPARKNYPRNDDSIKPQYVGHQFQFDLMSFVNEKEIWEEESYEYALIGLDTFSRYAFMVVLPDKTSEVVIQALQIIFDSNDYHPTTTLADPAGEHVSAKTRSFFEKRDIHLYYTNSKLHAPNCE